MATKPKPKFKVGDYIAAPTRVFCKVVAVLNDGPLPIYGTVNPKSSSKISWDSEYELTVEADFTKSTPDFKLWATVEAGDVIKTGWTEDRQFIRVLSRVGDAVMVSAIPHPEKLQELRKISKQIEEITDGQINPMDMFFDGEDKKMLKKIASTTHASKIADEWLTVEILALMNWQLIRE